MNFTFIQRVRNKIKVNKKASITIDKSVKMVDCSVLIRGKNNNLTIEENTVLRSVNIEIIGDNCIVGDGCGLSRNVKIMTSDGHPIFKDGKRINEAKDVLLGSHIWIADNVTILKGSTIGSGSVIGINSIVTKNIPIDSVAVGNPAKVVQENIEWKDKF